MGKRIKVLVSLVFLPLLMLLPCRGVFAQGSETQGLQKDYGLEEIIVTATRTPKSPESVPATVTVITREEIETMEARTLGDLLADLPGVQVYLPQGEGCVTPQRVRMRGMGWWGHVLVMLDGQPIHDPFTLIPEITFIPTKAIDRIEVIRGPFSALYGSSAGGGIINIITKDGGKKPYVEVFGETGDFGRRDLGANIGLHHKGYSLGVFYDHKYIDNYYYYDDKGINTRNRDYEHDRFHGKLTGSLGENTLFSFSGGIIDGDTGFGITDRLGLEAYSDHRMPYLNLLINHLLRDDLELSIRGDWLNAEAKHYSETLTQVIPGWPPRFIYRPSVMDSESSRSRVGANLNWTLYKGHIITVGGEALYTKAEKGTYDRQTGALLEVQGRPGEKMDKDDLSYGLYAQYDALLFNDKLELVLGGRFDSFETYGNEFSPKATIRWQYAEHGNLKFSVGKGFKAPTLNELYSPPWSIAPFTVHVGNPDLEAERLVSYELSLEQRLFDERLFFRISPYYTKGKDFISSVTLPDPVNPGGKIKTYDNVDKVDIKGVDVELSYKLFSFLTLFANYNYNETRDDKTDKILDDYPRNQLALGARGKYALGKDWSLSGYYAARYYDKYTETTWSVPPITQEVGDYWWHEVTLALGWKDMVNLKASCLNIFNDRTPTGVWATGEYMYAPERNFLVELSFKYSF